MSDTRSGRPSEELLLPALEALIFAADEPVKPGEIAEALGKMEVKEVEEALQTLQSRFEGGESGLRLERIAGGVRLATRPEVGAWVRQFFRQRNRTRLTPAALETLAIVAYRQPVTAPEIQAIRGKDPSAALRSLLDKKLIRLLGKKKVVGSPLLYGSSKHFLVHFGLNSLADLPSIDEFDEFIGALDEQRQSWFRGAPSVESESDATEEAGEDAGSEPDGEGEPIADTERDDEVAAAVPVGELDDA